MMNPAHIEIDGSVLEGGGQILRMAISLSALLGKSIRISKIRTGRPKPGLAAQHLLGIHLVRDMCDARLEGDQIGSTVVSFAPGARLRGGEYSADPRTAGSISLLLQVALPCALFADSPVTLHLKGGTNAEMAPQFDFMSEVFRPNLEQFGATFDVDLHRRGYFPRGGGYVVVTASPVSGLEPVRFVDRGHAVKFFGWSFVAGNIPFSEAEEMARGARRALEAVGGAPVDIESYKEDPVVARDNGSGVVLVCQTSAGRTLGGSWLGGRAARGGAAGERAAAELLEPYRRGAAVDDHTQDQLILYMALAQGVSSVRVADVTMHTKTAIYIAEMMTRCKFSMVEEGPTTVISCEGIGYRNNIVPSHYAGHS